MNPDYVARSLLLREDDDAIAAKRRLKGKQRQITEQHEWTLVAGLPPLAHLEREARQQAVLSEEQSRLQAEMDIALSSALQEQNDLAELEAAKQVSPPPTLSRRRLSGLMKGNSAGKASTSRASVSAGSKKRNWESHDVYRAIEKKDLTTLFEIRDAAFSLLVQKTGSQTPLLYASRIGKSHKEIAILLTGALSRFVNQLPDDASQLTPELQSQIRAVRANLKLAINESLTNNQTELISSYLQIIIMAEGDRWVKEQTQNLALILKAKTGIKGSAGEEEKPVQWARDAVKNFATRELRQLEKGNAVASVEDYLSNATNDLVMMAFWSLVTDKIGGGLLPSYQFGRDDRIFKTFSDSIHAASKLPDFTYKVPKHLRTQISETIKIMEGRSAGHAEKSRLLAELLDAPT